MECLSLNGWRVCQQKVHHNPRSGNGGLISTRRFFAEGDVLKAKGPQGWNPPNQAESIFLGQKNVKSFWEQMCKTIHINYSIPMFLGGGLCPFFVVSMEAYMHFKALNSLGDVYLSSTWRPGFPGTIPVTLYHIRHVKYMPSSYTLVHLKKNHPKTVRYAAFWNPPNTKETTFLLQGFWRKGVITHATNPKQVALYKGDPLKLLLHFLIKFNSPKKRIPFRETPGFTPIE